MIEKVVVIGAGTMGHGIAQLAAAAGCQVALHDIRVELIEKGLARVRENVEKAVGKGKMKPEEKEALLTRLRPAEELSGAVLDADLVIEAAPERVDLKRELAQACFAAKPSILFATNTSSLPVTAIAAGTRHPDRVIGMHFFNPPHLMKLVEIVVAEQTAPATVEEIARLATRMGKTVIRVKDSPGFATSRLGVLLGLEAIRMLETGVASAEDIDRAMEVGYNHPMGPLRLTDLVGLDVRLAIAEHLHEELGEQFRPPPLLRRMVRAGKLGKKAGQGFYRWEEE